MNIIQFIISIHALHQYKLLDTIRNIFDRDNQSDSDSESLADQSSDSTGPPSLESSQVFQTFQIQEGAKYDCAKAIQSRPI